MRFDVSKATVQDKRDPGNIAIMSVIYDRENQMAMAPIIGFSKGKLLASDIPVCGFGDEEEYQRLVQSLKEDLGKAATTIFENSSFDDGREAEEFLLKSVEHLDFDRDLVLSKLDEAAAKCFQPLKHYGWATPARGWVREPRTL